MSLTNIKNQLGTNLAAISGVTRLYTDKPDLAPSASECPCVIMDRQQPFLSWNVEVNGLIRYTWHFNVKFLYKPAALDKQEQWDAGIEPFPKRFVDKLWGDMTLTAAATMLGNRGDVDVHGRIEYMGENYFGFDLSLDVVEKVATTFA